MLACLLPNISSYLELNINNTVQLLILHSMHIYANHLLHRIITVMANIKTVVIRLSLVWPCLLIISACRTQVSLLKLVDGLRFITDVTSVLLTPVW